jgi:hypothetical protein
MEIHLHIYAETPQRQLRAMRSLIDGLLIEDKQVAASKQSALEIKLDTATAQEVFKKSEEKAPSLGYNIDAVEPVVEDEPKEPEVAEVAVTHTPLPAPVAANTPADAVGVDAENLPWDERIHSSNGQKNKDGTWRGRRGVSPIVLEQVRTELFARIAGQPSVSVPPAPPAAVVVPPAPPAPPVTVVAPPPPPAVAVPPAPPSVTTGPVAFTDVIQAITSTMTTKPGVTSEQVMAAISAATGVKELAQLNGKDSQVLAAAIDAVKGL